MFRKRVLSLCLCFVAKHSRRGGGGSQNPKRHSLVHFFLSITITNEQNGYYDRTDWCTESPGDTADEPPCLVRHRQDLFNSLMNVGTLFLLLLRLDAVPHELSQQCMVDASQHSAPTGVPVARKV